MPSTTYNYANMARWMAAEQLGNDILPTVNQLLAFLDSQMDKRGLCKSGFTKVTLENVMAATLDMFQTISLSYLACEQKTQHDGINYMLWDEGVKEAIVSEPGRFKGKNFAQQFAIHKAHIERRKSCRTNCPRFSRCRQARNARRRQS